MRVKPVVAPFTPDHCARLRLPANAEDFLVGRVDRWLQEDTSSTGYSGVDHRSPCNGLAARNLNLRCWNNHFCGGTCDLNLLPFSYLASLGAAWLAILSKIGALVPLL